MGTCHLRNERGRVAGAHEGVVELLASALVTSAAEADCGRGTSSAEEDGARPLDDFAPCRGRTGSARGPVERMRRLNDAPEAAPPRMEPAAAAVATSAAETP